MADEVNLALARIYERNGPGRIIGKREGVLASPRSAGRTTIVLRCQHLIVVAERLRQGIPFADPNQAKDVAVASRARPTRRRPS